MNKVYKFWVVLISILSLFYCDLAGVRIAVNKNVIDTFQNNFLPKLLQEFRQFKIPDKNIDVSLLIGTLHILLSNIHLEVYNLLADNIKISFLDPKIIKAWATNIKGKGNLNVQFKYGFISEIDSIDIIVSKLNLDIEIELTTKESSKFPGKMMPFAFISNLNLDIEFDFEIRGTVIAFIADLAKSKIKNYINNQIQSRLKQTIIDETKNFITKIVDQLPVYSPLANTGLSVDYSLLSPPKISNGYLIISTNGAVVNLNISKSINPPIPITTLPDFQINGKHMQLLLSEYVIHSAINSAILSQMLNIKIKSEDVPKESPIKLDTTFLETIITGISYAYGKDKFVDTELKVIDILNVIIEHDRINATLITEISFFVRIDNETSDEALKIKATVTVSGHIHVQEEFQIGSHIHYLQMSNITLVKSKVKDVDIDSIQIIFNFVSKIIILILNNNYLNKINVKLPNIYGINFGDSTFNIAHRYLELNLNPGFNTQLLTNLLMNECMHTKESRINKDCLLN